MNLIPVRWAAKAAHLLVLCAVLSVSLLAQAPPSADTFTVTSSPHTNYGGWPLIAVQPGSNGYLQFNLAHLPPNASVTKATCACMSTRFLAAAASTCINLIIHGARIR